MAAMKLTTKARYGTRALLDLAQHYGAAPVLLKEIAQRQEISLAYLEHIVGPLVAAGIIRSSRGARGGVTLARPAREITLGEAVAALEGPVALVECAENPRSCARSASCAVRDVWADMANAIERTLSSLTLQDLADRQRLKADASVGTYQI